MRQLLLRDWQRRLVPWIKQGIEQGGKFLGDPSVGAQHPVEFDHCDELPQALVELNEQKPVEAHAAVQQQHECVSWHVGNDAASKSDAVEPARLALQQQAFSEPSFGWDTDKAHWLTVRRYAGHLHQSLENADPLLDPFAF